MAKGYHLRVRTNLELLEKLCTPHHGIQGFERYVALVVLAKNIHRLGTVLREQQKERQRRKRGPYKKAA